MKRSLAVEGPTARLATIVFSKDRPLQLDATLQSLRMNCIDVSLTRIQVLYATSTAYFAAQYRVLAGQHPDVTLVREANFKADLVRLATSSTHLLFLVDDTLFVDSLSLATAVRTLARDPGCLGFSLRLGRNTTYCYTLDKPQRLPAFQQLDMDVLGFDWPGADFDFGYPIEVASSLFRSSDLLPLLQALVYTNPNTLETALATAAPSFASTCPRLACYARSKALSVPANLVQTAWDNRIGGRPELTSTALAKAFALGQRLDVAHYRGYLPASAHEELEFVFVRDPDVPTVSVVIPCYEQAIFLPDAVESVIAQTFAGWEIVIVDDGSTDDTFKVATRLIRRHPGRRISLVRRENGGLATARNTAITHARGRYILPLDADDEIAPQMLERCVALLEATPSIAIAYTDLQRFGDAHELITASEFDPIVLPIANQLNYCSLYRREVWEDIGGYNPNMVHGYEDWDFWVGAVEHGYAARRIPEALFRYRIRRDSMFQRALAHDADLRRQMRANHPRLYRPWNRLSRWCRRKVKGWAARKRNGAA